uniref:DHHC domain-containing protein n=1 Tax=Rhabditophanes sp. KR3021 TaxID=114890 RepID=A0AC35TVV5_9BILA
MVGDTHLNIGESSQIRTKVESGGLNLDGKTYRPHDLTKSSFLCCLLLFVWVIFNYETYVHFFNLFNIQIFRLPRFYDQNNAYCISQITGVLVFVWIVFVQLFLYTEPGIIPKDVYFETFKRLNDKELQSTSKLSLTSLDHKRIYCSICNIHRPKNVLHCIICQVCVVSHDHHCSLLGSCVGKRNYYLFVCQLFTGASLATIMSVCAWYIIWDGLLGLVWAQGENRVKWESHLTNGHSAPHSLMVEDNQRIPTSLAIARKKRNSCGCGGCDLFPNRGCCNSGCQQESRPLPLACCPPPPPPKRCCSQAFGPCCPSTPQTTCCKRPCCEGQRPDLYEEVEEEPTVGTPTPTAPAAGSQCCPAATPPAPPVPPPPPPPPPEAPVECCDEPTSTTQAPEESCGCPNGNCGCGRPCCFYKDTNCCSRHKPCCPPQLDCCPPIVLPQICFNSVPPCLRACPSCPCRKRIMLGKRSKRQSSHHCQVPAASRPVAQGTPIAPAPSKFLAKIIESPDEVASAPKAGRLFETSRNHRTKRELLCAPCINGRPILKARQKRNLDCVQCVYLKPQYDTTVIQNPMLPANPIPQSPLPYPADARERVKRNGCLPYPGCLNLRRRSKRNWNSQYCEPCGNFATRMKRDTERDTCLRDKYENDKQKGCRGSAPGDTGEDDGEGFRMKRQAYGKNGLLDLVKVIAKAATTHNVSPGGDSCLPFPSCVMAKRKRKKRALNKLANYENSLINHRIKVLQHEVAVIRHKRQFYAPDSTANCTPCPAWVTLALAAARKKRDAGGEVCDQTADCLNPQDYKNFMRKFMNSRKKRSARRPICRRCTGQEPIHRVKRAFGGPTINASAAACNAFPSCRTRTKRNLFEDCAICTPDPGLRRRKKRMLDTAKCYPCPNSAAANAAVLAGGK